MIACPRCLSREGIVKLIDGIELVLWRHAPCSYTWQTPKGWRW